jgi:hypothetical protein
VYAAERPLRAAELGRTMERDRKIDGITSEFHTLFSACGEKNPNDFAPGMSYLFTFYFSSPVIFALFAVCYSFAKSVCRPIYFTVLIKYFSRMK